MCGYEDYDSWCVCDEDTPASEKVIQNNGSLLENTLFHPEQPCKIRRYWIAL